MTCLYPGNSWEPRGTVIPICWIVTGGARRGQNATKVNSETESLADWLGTGTKKKGSLPPGDESGWRTTVVWQVTMIPEIWYRGIGRQCHGVGQ